MKVTDKKNNFLRLDKKYSSLKDSQVVILPILFQDDKKKSSQANSAKEIIKVSCRLEKYDEEMSREMCLEKGICTLHELNLTKESYKSTSVKISKAISALLNSEKFVVSINSSRSAGLPLIKASDEKFSNLSILHLDSKARMKVESKKSSEKFISDVTEFNANIVQAGVRSISKEENEFRKIKQVRQFLAREIKMGMYGDNWQELVDKNLSENVYVTIDLSVFDPCIFPNVESPEPGGLLWDEVLYLLKIIGQGRNIVGFDICGLLPNKSYPDSNYFAAKLIYKILNYAL